MVLHSLPSDTVRLIKSTQVITTPTSIVKELVENSLDAKATAVCVKLENYGFSRLEVRDNGSGICEEDMAFIAKPHYTSKISSFSDLVSLTSYGFRGEALASLCAVAEVIVTTKTKESAFGYIHCFDHDGNVTSKKPSATSNGTIVVASNLFKNIPVRHQFYKNSKRRRDELKKVEDLILAICLAVPNVHLTFSHDKTNIVQRNPSLDLRSALMNTFPAVFKDMISKTKKTKDIHVEIYLPNPGCCSNQNIRRSTADRLFILVNKRPITHKAIAKIVKAHYNQKSENSHGHYPAGVISLTVPPHAVDINLEPNKDKALLKDEEEVLDILQELLTELYGPVDKSKKSSGKKVVESSLEADTDITCTLSCITQPQEESSHTFHRFNEPENSLTSEQIIEDNYRMINEENQLDVPCIRNTVVTTNQASPDKRNGKDHKLFSLISKCSRLPEGQREILDPHSSHIVAVKEGIGIKSFSSDNAIGGKTQQQITSEKNNKENTVMKKHVITSTQASEMDEIFLSLSESCISHDKDFGNCFEETCSDFSKISSGKTILLDSNRQDTSGDISSACNDTYKAREISRLGGSGEHVFSKNDQENGIHKSQSKHDSNQFHESLIGSDGIPIFRIAPLPLSEDVPTSNMNDKSLSTEKENTCQVNFSCIDKGLSISAESNLQEFQKLHSQEKSSELCQTSVPESSGGSWSRGHIVKEENIQTVQLAKPKDGVKSASSRNSLGSGLGKRTRPSATTEIQDSQTTPPKKSKIKSLDTASFDYIHGNPVKKASTPFILFSRDIRSQVLSENPGADFAFIVKEIASRWKAVNTETKACYIDQAKVDTDRYQEEVRKIKERRGLSNTLNSSSHKDHMTRASLDRYVAPLTPHLTKSNGKSTHLQSLIAKRPWRDRQKEITVTVDSIREILKKNRTDLDSYHTLRLLGPLSVSGGWICLKERNIIGLNTSRLHETLLVHRLLKTFKFPLKDLSNSIPFNESVIGGENWNLLLRLQREQIPNRNFYIITDHRLLSSGFKVALYPGTSSSYVISHGEIVGMTNVVGFYGINDLKDLLSTLVTCPSSSIEKTRPLKVQEWLKGEAVRLVRSGPNIMRREEVLENLEKWHSIHEVLEVDNVTGKYQQCIHSKPIFTTLYCLDDLPQSQSQAR